MAEYSASFIRRFRFFFVALGIIFAASVAYAVFAPALGIRQNQADEEFQKGWLLFQDRKFDAAVEKLSEALRINPQFHWARRFLAEAYYFSGQLSDALDEYEALARTMPHDLTLKNRIEALSSVDENQTVKATEFLRVLPRTQGYRYNRPTFVGLINPDRFAVLSLGNFDIGSMVSYSAQGEPVENQHRISGKLGYPMAFAQNEDEVWISDFKEDKIHRLKKKAPLFFSYFFNPKAIGKSGSGQLEFRAPAGLCHRKGEFIVADSENNRLQRIADNGAFIAEIQRPQDVDSLVSPFGVWCNEDAIWITEPTAGRVTHFDRYGSIVAEYSPRELKKPRHIEWDDDESVFLIADESAGILKMNTAGEILDTLKGYRNNEGRFVEFARAYAASFDAFRNLYVADYGASEVIQFVPQSEKFAPLYLHVEKVNAAKFPIIGIYVTVATGEKNRASAGKTNYLTELKAEDFKVLENDAPVGNLDTAYLSQFEDILQMAILVSRSTRMKDYETQLPWVLDHIFTKIREKDRFEILTHGEDIRRESDFTASRLALLKSIRTGLNPDFLTEKPLKTASAALYDSLSDLLNKEGKRAVLYITDGGMDDDALNPYTKVRIIDYARANHIPIFVVSFENPAYTSDARDTLKELAEKTGGMYYRALEIDPKIENILRSQNEVRYLLGYKSKMKKQVRGQYVDLRVMARFRERRGLDLNGYFIP
ncbi:MAG: hypothetical protein LDLANPLL_01289 [Turneriella sp.]|nr:hypothetical protein [Turneriella sp.]